MRQAAPSRLQRPAVLITGASSGIGAAAAALLASKHFHVFAGFHRLENGRRLTAAASDWITPLALDVTDAASIAAAAATISDAVGNAGLAGLVNNAGIVVVAPLEIVPLDVLRRQLEVNVVGLVAVTQAMLPLIRAAHGRIVNIGSFNGFIAPPYFGPYTASKYALEALTDCMRVELRQWKISVSIIEPTSIRTPIWRKTQERASALIANVSPERYSLYERDLAAVQAASVKLERAAIPVERVVQVIRHALTAPQPRTRYPVGVESRLARFGARLLPDRFRDRLLKLGLGLK